MKERIATYKSYDRFNYLCIVATEMGLDNLAPMVTLLANFESVLNHPLVVGHRLAVKNLRRIGVMPLSEKSLSRLASDYQEWHASADPSRNGYIHQRFEIRSGMSFGSLWIGPTPSDVVEARNSLYAPLQPAANSIAYHSTSRPTYAAALGDFGLVRVKIDSLKGPVYEAPLHDSDRTPKPIDLITWDDVLAQARVFDKVAEKCGEVTKWESTFIKEGIPSAILKSVDVAADELTTAVGIDLSGVRHLIGLPGSGKSTLLQLLAAILFGRGHKVAFFFPSIAVATDFVESLDKYGVPVGLLYGQSQTSRRRHVARLADQLGRRNGGFGQTRSAAPFFANTCALGGYAADIDEPFPFESPPCATLLQATEKGSREQVSKCALAGVCGRNKAIRELASAQIWASHISSTDAPVPSLFSSHKIHYFEHIARSFDLVVVDEVDNAHELLDSMGSDSVALYGQKQSFAEVMAAIKAPLMEGRNASMSRASRSQDAVELDALSSANYVANHIILSLDGFLQDEFESKLLTTTRLFASLYPSERSWDNERTGHHRRVVDALEMLWTVAAKTVVYGGGGDLGEDYGDDDIDVARYVGDLGVGEADIARLKSLLREHLSDWCRARAGTGRDKVTELLADTLIEFLPSSFYASRPDGFRQLVSLTAAITFVVLRYLMVIQFLRQWVSEGALVESSFVRRPSMSLVREMPESLLGRLAGVKYALSRDENSINQTVSLKYVDFITTPRALLLRYGTLYRDEGRPGAAVLATSATSFLETSPTYHLDVGPDYVLARPAAGAGWSRSRYQFVPLRDPADAGRFLRFSGTPQSKKPFVLAAMADQLFAEPPFGLAFKALQNNDAKGEAVRNIGLVVNSYQQCMDLVEHICLNMPEIAPRVRGVIKSYGEAGLTGRYITTAMVEDLCNDKDWNFLVFPMGAIGRGVNLVFPDGPRKNEAMLGSLFFLTRPHPSTEGVAFLRGLAAQRSMAFDQADLRSAVSIRALTDAHKKWRSDTLDSVQYLLRNPLIMANLGPLMKPFVADQMIPIIQTIGRTMRNDCPGFIYFVDSAWANEYSKGQIDTAASSMLVMMLEIFEELFQSESTAKAAIYRELYEPFYKPLRNMIETMRREVTDMPEW